MNRWSLAATASLLCLAAAASAGPVVTFSPEGVRQSITPLCPAKKDPQPLHIRRNADGSLISIIEEGKQETVLQKGTQTCNPLEEVVLDLWRDGENRVAGMVVQREEGRKLMLGNSEFRGLRYDIDPSGTYFLISQGQTSTMAAIQRPFRKLLDLDLDGQRIFLRKGGLIVFGANPATGRTEFRSISVSAAGVSVAGSGPVGNQPAGVRVLDYDEQSDEVLLGGTGASGQPALAIVQVSTGRSRNIATTRQGDSLGMFIKDGGLRKALTGDRAAAPGTGGGGLSIPFFN